MPQKRDEDILTPPGSPFESVTPATGTAIQARKTNSAASILTPANEPEWNLDAGTNVGLARLREELKKRTIENPMATKRQVEANRQNAQKSTGPKTPEGKQIVSANAVTHGSKRSTRDRAA